MNVVLALRLMNEFVFDYLEVNKYLFAGQRRLVRVLFRFALFE